MPYSRNDWRRSARRGGPGWQLAGLLVIVALVIGLLKALGVIPDF